MDRFWSQVNVGGPDECWPWLGRKCRKGYGRVTLSRPKRVTGAHRFAYELTYSAPPRGMSVCHHCDNRACCNPAHLFLGTNKDNVADMDRKGRRRTAKGAERSDTKLTEAKVVEIRRLHAAGASCNGLARQFGVSSAAISGIVRRQWWKHVKDGVGDVATAPQGV